MARRILLVDDTPDILILAAMSLEQVGGHEVRTATSGPECLETLAHWTPDVVILDVRMPGMDGPAVLGEIRTIAATHDLPVVFLTASVVAPERERLAALPVSGVLVKPFDPLGLPGELAAVLGW